MSFNASRSDLLPKRDVLETPEFTAVHVGSSSDESENGDMITFTSPPNNFSPQNNTLSMNEPTLTAPIYTNIQAAMNFGNHQALYNEPLNVALDMNAPTAPTVAEPELPEIASPDDHRVNRRRSSIHIVAAIPLPQTPPPACDCMRTHGTSNEIIAEANLSDESRAYLETFSTWSYDDLYNYLMDFGGLEMGETLCALSLLMRLRSLMEEMEISVLGAVQNLAEVARTPPAATTQAVADAEVESETPPALAILDDTTELNITIPAALGICIICMDNPRECAIVPCGHISCCLNCASSPLLRHCPNCREEIEEVLQVYLT